MLGIGEIGLNRITRNEIATYTEQVELALAHRQLILIHTPHLEDKLKGTRISIDVLRRYPRADPGRVLVDHAEEHTIEMILEHGYWAGLTLYPQTKISPQRAVDVIEKYGPDRICVAGACDWGPSDPIAVPRFAMEMRRRRHPGALIQRVIFENPVKFLSQSPKFELPAGVGAARTVRGSAADGAALAASTRPTPASTSPTAPTSMPADGWAAVDANLRRFAPALKARLSPARPFGLGLRLSARDARELLAGPTPRRVPTLSRRRRACTSR